MGTEQRTAGPSVRGDKTMAAVMLAGMCTFLNVYPTQPLLPYFRHLFHASELAVSFTVSATVFAVALVAPFVGVLAERQGRKRVIVPSLLLLSMPTVLCGSARSLKALIGWRFLQGVFVPGVIAVMLAYIVEEWEGRGVGRAMAAYVSGTVMGGFLGRFLSGLITTHWNWRAAFVALGVFNLLGALAVAAWLPRATRFVRAEHMGHALAEARRHLQNRRLLANFGMGAAILFGLVGCFTYTNFYLAAPPFHLNAAQLGSIFFVYLVGVVVTPISGKFLDHYGFRPTAYLYCGMMMTGLLLTLVRSLPAVIAGLAIFSSGVFIAQAAATVETGAIAGRARSSAAGLYVTFYYLGGSLGATATGWFWQWAQWRGCVAILGTVAVVSLGLALLSSRPGEQLHGEEAEIVGD
ncbi:MAG TPA: MFS transporter [Terriglobales bacterium]|jgi:predicted MFS family arabinose efflux permease|nr:MFS transporter [Terriglobales bacterium]